MAGCLELLLFCLVGAVVALLLPLLDFQLRLGGELVARLRVGSAGSMKREPPPPHTHTSARMGGSFF
jgi:hypothetical protein